LHTPIFLIIDSQLHDPTPEQLSFVVLPHGIHQSDMLANITTQSSQVGSRSWSLVSHFTSPKFNLHLAPHTLAPLRSAATHAARSNFNSP
jgi:hypothetical protein